MGGVQLFCILSKTVEAIQGVLSNNISKKRIRFILQSIHGDLLFYMKDDKENVCGYILLEYGGNTSRYPWVSNKDWVISPYVVRPELRGQGLGKQLLIDLKNDIAPLIGGNVYADVRVNNIPSIRAMEAAGFKQVCWASINQGLLRKYTISEEPSDYVVYSMK